MTLTFCIPTLNRVGFIPACLDSILDQWQSNIEVVILDGGSTDGTPELIAKYMERQTGIRFYRTEERRGIDRDILATAELASGDYIWFMGDDDCLMPGAIEYVLNALETAGWPAGASVNYVSFDRTLTWPIATVPAVSRGKRHADFLYKNLHECFAELGVHLGYLSAQIVRRKTWEAAVKSSVVGTSIGSCWIITSAIWMVINLDSSWLYIHRPSVKNRTSNDSFVERLGVIRRQELTHSTFEAVIIALFGPLSDVLRSIHMTLIYDRMPRTLAKLKAEGATVLVQIQLLKLYLAKYARYPAFWFRVFPLFLIPNLLLRFARHLYLGVRCRSASSKLIVDSK